MREIYYKSDFNITEPSEDYTIPFRFKYYVSGEHTPYIACYNGKSYQNCKVNDDGTLSVCFIRQNMGVGFLVCEKSFYLDDPSFIGGVRTKTYLTEYDIELVETTNDEILSEVYEIPVITRFVYPDIPFDGGSVTPVLVYKQEKTITYTSGKVLTEIVTDEAQVVYEGNGVDTATGEVTADSTENSDKTLITTAKVTVTMNGLSATASAKVYQEKMTVKTYLYNGSTLSNAKPTSIDKTVFRKLDSETTIPYQEGGVRCVYYAVNNGGRFHISKIYDASDNVVYDSSKAESENDFKLLTIDDCTVVYLSVSKGYISNTFKLKIASNE